MKTENNIYNNNFFESVSNHLIADITWCFRFWICLLITMMFATQSAQAQNNNSHHIYFINNNLQAIPHVIIKAKNNVFKAESDNLGRVEVPQNIKTDSFYISNELYERKVISKEDLLNGPSKIILNAKMFSQDPFVVIGRGKDKKSNLSSQTDVLDNKKIKFLSVSNTADLLESSGKVHIQKSQQGGGSPIMRGFEANKVLLVVDGIRMNNAIYRSGHLQNIITVDPMLLGGLEVLHGSGSTLYGSDALGGVIYLKSKRAKIDTSGKNKFSGDLIIKSASAARETMVGGNFFYAGKKWGSYSSFSTLTLEDLKAGKNRALYPGSWGENKYIVYRKNNRDTFYLNRNPEQQNHSGFSQMNFAQKLLFMPKSSVKHILNFQYSTSTNIPRYDRMNTIKNKLPKFGEWYYGPQKRLLAAYTFKKRIKSKLVRNIESILAFQDIEESRHTRRYQSNILKKRTENVQIYSYNLNLNKKRGKRKYSYGMEAIYNTIKSTAYTQHILTNIKGGLDTRYPDGNNYTASAGLFFQHNYTPNKKWVLNQGIRLSYNHLHSEFEDTNFFNFPVKTINNNNVAPSVNFGFVFKPSKQQKHYLSLSTAYRTPNLDDIAKVFDTKDDFVIIPNAYLKPENTYNIEYGFSKKIRNKFETEMVLYHTIYHNAIVVGNYNYQGKDSILYNGSMSNVAAAQNAKKAYIQGFNWTIKYFINKKLYLSNTLNYTYGRIKTDSSLIPLDHITPVGGKFVFGAKQKRFNGELSVLYAGAKTLKDYNPNGEDNLNYAPVNGNGLPGWFRVDFTSSYAFFSYLTLYAGIENILDFHYRTYASGISAPGRNVKLSVVVNF